MSRTTRGRRRSFLATLDLMERRELLSTVPVLMTDGAQASQPTWGQTPTPPGDLPLAVNSFFLPESLITKDIQGNPIDFNKDGYPDLLETGQAEAYVGYGTQTSMIVSGSRGTFAKVALGGPNGPVFSNKGAKVLGSVTVQATGTLMAVADLNGDSYQDILTTNANSSVAGSGFHMVQWLYDPQQQSFSSVDLPTTLNGWCEKTGQMTLGDVTGDGVPDLVVPSFSTTTVPDPANSSLLVFPMTGFQVFEGTTSGGSWIGDFAANPISSLTLKQQSAEWGIQELSGGTSSPFGTVSVINSVLADLDGDGKLDLAIPEADGVTVFPNPGNGVFVQGAGVFIPSAGAANGLNLVAGDFNNDGKTDLASSPNYISTWLKRFTSPGFSVWTASQAPISVYLNTTPSGGPISFTTNAVTGFDAMSGWNGTIAVADFNGDGNLDIAVASCSNRSTQNGIVTGDGTGQFATLALYQAYSNSADGYDDSYQRAIDYLAVSDFNNDGQVDIVATALNIGPMGSIPPSGSYPDNPAVGITGVSYNRTFAAPGVMPQTVTATVNQPLAQTLTPTGGDPSKIYLFSLNSHGVPLPNGLTLSPTGQITGTPTVSGPFQLTLDIVQPNGPRSVVHLNLNVETASFSSVLPGVMPNAIAGLPFQQQITATLGPATWIVTAGGLPAGLTLSSGGLISGTPMATGVYQFTVQGTGSGFQTVMNYQLMVQAAAAPVVNGVARYGYHKQPTIYVVTFSQAMDPASASNLGNYVLTTAGRDGRFGTRDDRVIPLRSVTYDVNALSATLTPARTPLPLTQLYRLWINGMPTAGLRNTTGIYLGGEGAGAAGTSFMQVLGPHDLAGPNNPVRTRRARVGAR